jgi:hypothetical protein
MPGFERAGFCPQCFNAAHRHLRIPPPASTEHSSDALEAVG